MQLNLTPVSVDISIEQQSITRNAFYSLCFITENDEAPRTIEVSKLSDLLDNGYTRDSLAYNFCVGVFSQSGMSSVFIRAKRSNETYEDAYIADENSGYYYIVIESKDSEVIDSFNDLLISENSYKLLFYSSPTHNITNKKIVHYYQNDSVIADSKDYYINKAFNKGLEITIPNTSEAQLARLAYPEAAWISRCGSVFPSKVQWLHKYLPKADVYGIKTIPDLSTTTAIVMGKRATVGSGMTAQGIFINEQVSLDWTRWALSKELWRLLYTTTKLPATKEGLDIAVSTVRYVLDISEQQEIFSSYSITGSQLKSQANSASVSFRATLTHSILNADISGTVYY